MIFAVIPAAGYSVRMGRPKLALPLGGRTVLEWVITALRRARVEHVLVVIGPHVPELAPLAESAGASVLRLDRPTLDMRATVEEGLRWLEQRFQPQDDDGWLLVPADHPALDAAAIAHLIEARQLHPQHSIFIATHEGRRGHPALIAWRHVAGVRSLTPGLGLNAYLRLHTADTLELPVLSPHILCDLDTPEDYQRLCLAFAPKQ